MQNIPEQIISDIGQNIPFNSRILLPSGRKMHVHFIKSIQSLSHIGSLIKECKKCCGSILVVAYKGSGNFSIYIFNDDGSEIEYIIPKKLSLDNVCHQGILNFFIY